MQAHGLDQQDADEGVGAEGGEVVLGLEEEWAKLSGATEQV